MPSAHIRSNLKVAAISGWVLCAAAMPADGNAAVSPDQFLIRTTGDLVELCRSNSADTYYTAAINCCHGFSVGVYSVLQEENQASSRPTFCIPDPAPRRADMIARFVQWTDANPDQKQQAPADGIAAFLTRQFPCGRGK